MSIFVTGDTHGTLDIDKLPIFFESAETPKHLSKENDFLIICGDVCACGFNIINERRTREILSSLPVTVLFVDGNHENFDLLEDYPVEKWNCGNVHFVEDDIIHLMRGQVFELCGKKLFTFGGAYSIDCYRRTEGIDWFPQELPTEEEMQEGLRNLAKTDWSVDYIITHMGPAEVTGELGFGYYSDAEEKFGQYLQRIADECTFSDWYFGHYHEDFDVEEMYHCLYDNIIQIC